jgi:hypothetical protein
MPDHKGSGGCSLKHLARTPAGLITRITARVLALCAAIHLNWQLGQHTRALSVYGY